MFTLQAKITDSFEVAKLATIIELMSTEEDNLAGSGIEIDNLMWAMDTQFDKVFRFLLALKRDGFEIEDYQDKLIRFAENLRITAERIDNLFDINPPP